MITAGDFGVWEVRVPGRTVQVKVSRTAEQTRDCGPVDGLIERLVVARIANKQDADGVIYAEHLQGLEMPQGRRSRASTSHTAGGLQRTGLRDTSFRPRPASALLVRRSS